MNKRILFINDYASASVIPGIVADAGFSVDSVKKSEVALSGATVARYDLIIFMESPYADIWADCEKIRKSISLPLIVISPEATTETSVKAINAGADYFLRKPFGYMELIARISSLLQRAACIQPMSLAS
jgi:two-component system response regulator VicR